ncbi:MAG: hypothetical protein OEW39_01035 [Deltaproteobacteria bacterium]|nr:hypothetical protein [Deltaproteobacteria bacterium]
MGTCLRTVCVLGFALSVALTVQAKPGNGLGLQFGSDRADVVDTGTGYAYSTLRAGGSLDYQWALGSAFSLLLLLDEAKGEAVLPAQPAVRYFVLDSLGLEARLWLGALWIGGQFARCALTAAEGATSFQIGGAGSCRALTLGLEGQGRWFLALRALRAQRLPVEAGPTVTISGTRLSLGYRWK